MAVYSEDSENFCDPDITAAEILEAFQAALAQFAEIASEPEAVRRSK